MKKWWQNSICIWLSGWTGWLCTMGQKAEPREKSQLCSGLECLFQQSPGRLREHYWAPHSESGHSQTNSWKELIAQATTPCLCPAQPGCVQGGFVTCITFGVCPWTAWVHSHSSRIKTRLSAATLQISIMHWVGLVLCRSVWPALQVPRAAQQILGSPTFFGLSESEHRFDLWMRCRSAAPSAC